MPRSCCGCQQSFEPSKYRPDQSFCSQPDCQRQRRAEYHRRKIETDPVYAGVVNDSRKKWTEYCVMCHNPSNTDASTRPTAVVASDKTQPPRGINFNMLVHRIHFGPNAAADGAKNPCIVVGYGGSHNDFCGTLYPALSPAGAAGDTRNCSMCHLNGSEQILPLGLNPVVDPQGWVNPNQAIAGAYTGCHTAKSEASHMLANTSVLGESCTVCHNIGAAYAVNQVHAQY